MSNKDRRAPIGIIPISEHPANRSPIVFAKLNKIPGIIWQCAAGYIVTLKGGKAINGYFNSIERALEAQCEASGIKLSDVPEAWLKGARG